MTKDQCSAIIKAICKTAEYLAIVNILDDKNIFDGNTISGAVNSQALDPLNEKFEEAIDEIIDDIPDDPADDTTPQDEPPANDTTPDNDQEGT